MYLSILIGSNKCFCIWEISFCKNTYLSTLIGSNKCFRIWEISFQMILPLINLTSVLTVLPDKNGSFFSYQLRNSQNSTIFGPKCTYFKVYYDLSLQITKCFGPKYGDFWHFLKSLSQMSMKSSGNAVRILAKIFWSGLCLIQDLDYLKLVIRG